MRLDRLAILFIVAVGLVLEGCTDANSSTNPNVNANHNSNSTSNSNANVNDDATTDELTEAEAAAVEEAIAVMKATATTLAGASFVTDPPENDGTFGECPQITGTAEQGAIEITLDYVNGCTNGATGDVVLSGSVTGTVDNTSQSVSLSYAEFSIDGQSVNGTLSFFRSTEQADDDSFNITADLTVAGLGRIQATMTVTYESAAQQITLAEGSFTFTDEGGGSRTMLATGLVFDPVTFGNFIPADGTLVIETANEDPPPTILRITVTFDANSPVDGTVDVQFGSTPTIEYQLEGDF